MVDPRHFRDVSNDSPSLSLPNESQPLLRERTRRIRDAVEGALADILLLGTKEHVRLAEDMVRHLLEGKVVYTHELVMSLRTFIRQALDLESIPTDIHTPLQGPTRVVNYQKNKDTNKKQNNYEKDEKIKKPTRWAPEILVFSPQQNTQNKIADKSQQAERKIDALPFLQHPFWIRDV